MRYFTARWCVWYLRHGGARRRASSSIFFMVTQIVMQRFRGEYAFLSNFYIEPDGTHVEGEYQAAKCTSKECADLIRSSSPSMAKKLGQTVVLSKKWTPLKKMRSMYKFVLQKFKDHEELKVKLLHTDNAQLVELNWWGDTYWGVCGTGKNYLGRILMSVRRRLAKCH